MSSREVNIAIGIGVTLFLIGIILLSLFAAKIIFQPNVTSFSEWSPCSGVCGSNTGTQSRTMGALVETRVCTESCEEDWSEWSNFSPCNNACGDGTKYKTRTCQGERCDHDAIKIEPCNAGPCATAPIWSAWSQWSECSAQCAGGTKFRRRVCLGVGCKGVADETMVCNEQACPPGWGEWNEFGKCVGPCGRPGGVRTRECKVPDSCTGSATQPCISQCTEGQIVTNPQDGYFKFTQGSNPTEFTTQLIPYDRSAPLVFDNTNAVGNVASFIVSGYAYTIYVADGVVITGVFDKTVTNNNNILYFVNGTQVGQFTATVQWFIEFEPTQTTVRLLTNEDPLTNSVSVPTTAPMQTVHTLGFAASTWDHPKISLYVRIL